MIYTSLVCQPIWYLWKSEQSFIPISQVKQTEIKDQLANLCVRKHFQGLHFQFISLFLQLSSAAQSCPTLCNPMDCSTPDLPVHHQLPGFTQIHVH